MRALLLRDSQVSTLLGLPALQQCVADRGEVAAGLVAEHLVTRSPSAHRVQVLRAKPSAGLPHLRHR